MLLRIEAQLRFLKQIVFPLFEVWEGWARVRHYPTGLWGVPFQSLVLGVVPLFSLFFGLFFLPFMTSRVKKSFNFRYFVGIPIATGIEAPLVWLVAKVDRRLLPCVHRLVDQAFFIGLEKYSMRTAGLIRLDQSAYGFDKKKGVIATLSHLGLRYFHVKYFPEATQPDGTIERTLNEQYVIRVNNITANQEDIEPPIAWNRDY